jgi:hypothetical protein
MAFRPSGKGAFTPLNPKFVELQQAIFSTVNGAFPDGLKAIPPIYSTHTTNPFKYEPSGWNKLTG